MRREGVSRLQVVGAAKKKDLQSSSVFTIGTWSRLEVHDLRKREDYRDEGLQKDKKVG